MAASSSSASETERTAMLDMTCTQAAPALRSGRRSQAAYVGALLSRFEEVKFDAMLLPSFSPEALRERLGLAAPVPAAAAGGAPAPAPAPLRGALAGVPFLVTPNVDVAGMRSHAGCKVLEPAAPQADAAVVAALRGAGAVVFGQANMHALGMGVSCANAAYGTVKNPFTAFGIAGGSAGGAAAAVAARLTPFAVTIDSSLGDARVPAALCGVVGFRPTHGRYSREGLLSTSHTLDSAGFIARTVHDVQLLDAVVCAAMRVAEAPPAAAAADGEGKEGESKEAEVDPQAAAALKMQSMSRGFLARKRVEKVAKGEMGTAAAIAKPPSQAELDKEKAAAAARIQAVARGKADRAQVGRVAIEKESAESRLAALTKSDDAAATAAAGDAKAARAAADAALAAEGARVVASGHEVYEEAAHAANEGVSGAAGPPAADWSGKAAFVKDLAGVRIGVPRRRYYDGLDASLAAVVEEALRRLAKAGAVLVECDFAPGTTRDNDRHPIDLAADVVGPVAAFEVPRELASYLYTHVAAPEEKKKPAEGEEPAEEEEESEEAKAARLAAGPPPPRPLDSVLSVTAVLKGFEGSAAERAALTAQLSRATAGSSTTYRSALVYRRPALKRVFATLLKSHKLACIVYPTTPLPAAAMLGEERNLVELNGELVDATAAYTRNTSAASAAGLPALSIPCGMTRPRVGAHKGSPGAERLPVSLEFVADANDDERLLSLGRAVQRLQSAISDPLVLREWSNGLTAPHQ